MTRGEKIRKLRIDKGLTQDELAEKVGACATTICRIENDQLRRPHESTLEAIANALEVSRGDINSGPTPQTDEILQEILRYLKYIAREVKRK